jgi:putative endonuclease
LPDEASLSLDEGATSGFVFQTLARFFTFGLQTTEPEGCSVMFHVYVIVSETHPDRYYVGFSSRPNDRLKEHNEGKNPSTAAFMPWRFAAIFSFPSEQQARRFERYLKGGSGRAFLRRHVLYDV